MLQNLFAAVAPGSLWPVDVLLRVLFCDVDQASVVNEINRATSLLQSVFFQVKQLTVIPNIFLTNILFLRLLALSFLANCFIVQMYGRVPPRATSRNNRAYRSSPVALFVARVNTTTLRLFLNYTEAQRYEFYFPVAKQWFTNERSEWVKDLTHVGLRISIMCASVRVVK